MMFSEKLDFLENVLLKSSRTWENLNSYISRNSSVFSKFVRKVCAASNENDLNSVAAYYLRLF